MISLYGNPHATFTVRAPPTSLVDLRTLVPGVLVHGKGARRWVNVTALRPWDHRAEGAEPLTSRLTVAAPGVTLVEGHLRARGLAFDVKVNGDLDPLSRGGKDVSDAIVGPLIERGRTGIRRLAAEGWVRDGLAERVYPMQAELVGRIEGGARALLLVWPGGSGKTWAALLAAFTAMSLTRAPIVCVVPSNVRPGWARDAARITDTEIHVCLPSSKGGGAIGLHAYLERMAEAGRPPILVVGQEHLAYWMNFIPDVQPGVVIFDEIDTIANRSLYEVKYRADGEVDISFKTTAGGVAARGAAAAALTMLPSVKVRVGLTATPLWNGIPEKLWGVAHLVWPGVFGFGFYDYGLRYCGGAVPEGGFGVTYDKPTNIAELKRRCTWFVHYVSYAESHGHLPPMVYKVATVPVEEQDKTARFSEGMTWGQAIKAAAKGTVADDTGAVYGGTADDGGDVNPGTSTYELTLAHACALKRSAVVERAVSTAMGAGKVIVAVGRIAEARAWALAIETALTRRTPKGATHPPRTWMMIGDGSSVEARMEALNSWRDYEGGAVGVITYQAMGAGVDGMQVADHFIIAQLPPTGRDLEQLIKRADRANRTKPVLMEIVIAENTREVDHLKRQAENYRAFAAFLGDANFEAVAGILAPQRPYEEVLNNFLDGLF